MTTAYITPENEAHWLAMRGQDLTSTEASALFGMSPYATAYELYLSKRGEIESPFEDNARIQAGRHLEPAIASLAAERYGLIAEPFKQYARDAERRVGSSFDWKVVGVTHAQPEYQQDADTLRALFEQHGPGILELKNVDGLAFKRKWQDDETPAHIEIQLQHQLDLTGMAWGAVVALVGGHTTAVYAREHDAEFGTLLRETIAGFWRCVDDGVPPPVIYPDDADVIIAMHQHDDGSVYDARGNEEIARLIAEYDASGDVAGELEERRKVIKAQVLEMVGAAKQLVWEGGKVSLTQTKDSAGTLVTEEMVGTHVGSRRGYRMFRSYPKAQEASK